MGRLLLACGFIAGGAAQAQIVPDATLPTNSITTTNGDTITVTGGTQSGVHLFHSFDEFSIATDQIVTFDHALDLDTLITRVTGSSISTIEGILETQGRADFFLLNPNGIVFSDTAQLNVGGSFIASTADSLFFDNGGSFSAINPQAPPLLTVNTPVGLQYGSQPGEILANGGGHNLSIDPDTLEVIRRDRPNGLQVNDGETLALLGGSVTLDGGNLTAQDGRIILNAVTEGGEMILSTDALGWTANVSKETPVDAIALINASSLLTTGNNGGAVHITGQFIDVLDGSTVLASTEADGAGQGIRLQAAEEFILSGTQLDAITGESLFPSSLLAEVALGATGTGGDLFLSAPFILLENGAQASTTTFGQGLGGDIKVNASEVEIFGGTPEFGSSGFFLNTDIDATGQGGSLTMQANQLTVAGGGNLSSNTFGFGQAGQITLLVDEVLVTGGSADLGSSRIFSQTEGSGDGGTIQFESDRLQVFGGGEIAVDVFGSGDGGRINIVTNTVTVAGTSPSGAVASNISSTVQADSGTGQGGDITIQTTELNILAGAQITSETFSQSTQNRAGNITIDAESIQLTDENSFTGIFASVTIDDEGNIGQNNGGNITLQADTLTVENGAQIVVSTLGPGDAGTLNITASDIALRGRDGGFSSGLFASAIEGSGRGGNIELTTDSLSITNGATINASNFPSSSGADFSPGQGAAGDIIINAPSLQLDNEGSITTSTNGGDRGNIRLNSDLITLSDRASITTDARADATGGNILITTDFLIANPNENSDITANAIRGRGGSIDITAQRIFGLEFRDQLTPQSDITVSSEFGVDGEVIIDLLAIDSTSDLGTLPSGVVDESDRITPGCPADQDANFIATGRGGLPDTLSQQGEHPIILQALERTLDASDSQILRDVSDPQVIKEAGDLAAIAPRYRNDSPRHPSRRVTEAQGWHYASDGAIELTAYSTTVSDISSEPLLDAIACLRRTNT